MSRLGIEMLTVLGMPPVELVRLAAELGCSHVSMGPSGLPMAQFGISDWNMFPMWSISSDAKLRHSLKNELSNTGIRIALGEGFRVREDGDVRDRAAGLDIMAELGAERINAVSMEPDIRRTYDQLAELCEMVTERGMMFTIEFAPPNTINSLAGALAAIDHIGCGKCRLLIDAMHFFRSGATVAELGALDPDLIGYAQLCDAPLVSKGGTYMQEAMFERMVPGEGEFPLADFIAALPDSVDIGLEVPNLSATLAEGSPRGVAARSVAAANRIMETAECRA
jgi:sugar phosphate isomerase/epimerase